MTPEQRLHAAQQALKAGRKAEAARLLQTLIHQTPDDYRPWLLLAGLAPTPQASLECIARAEQLNPGDLAVARARHWAEKQLQSKVASSPVNSTAAPVVASMATRPETPHDPFDQLRQKASLRPGRKSSSNQWPTLLVGLFLIIMLVGLMSLTAFMIVGQPQNGRPVANNPPTTTPTPIVSYHFDPAGYALPPSPTVTIQPLQPKNIVRDDGQPRPTWTITPLPTNTPSPTPTPYPTFISSDGESVTLPPIDLNINERWVDVDLSSQTLIAYEGINPVFETLISSGVAAHPTVTGQFRIWLRFESQTMDGSRLGYDYYLENVPYVMYFYQDYALHGTFWHNNFGHPMSHGCVNMATPDAEWMFNWSSLGTLVNVHN